MIADKAGSAPAFPADHHAGAYAEGAMPLSPVDVENQRKLREFDVPTFGYRLGEDGGVEKEIFDGEIPDGWVDSPAKVNDLPLIKPKERAIAREVRAMISAGKKNAFILVRFPGIDARFIERVRADPSTLKEDLIARRAARKWRNVEKWVKKNPPALPTEWQDLPEPNVTLCEAVTWRATGAPESAKWLRERDFDPGSRADMLLWKRIEMAQRLVEEAAADGDLCLFGQKETSSGERSGKDDERLPASAFLARAPRRPAGLDLAHDTITIGSTRYVSVTMRRKDLFKLWPAAGQGAADEGKISLDRKPDKLLKDWFGQKGKRGGADHQHNYLSLSTVLNDWLDKFGEEYLFSKLGSVNAIATALRKEAENRLPKVPSKSQLRQFVYAWLYENTPDKYRQAE